MDPIVGEGLGQRKRRQEDKFSCLSKRFFLLFFFATADSA
jgi:hypothetical protein